MKDKFAALEEPKSRALPVVIIAFLLVCGLFVYRLSHIKPIPLLGIVEVPNSAQSMGSAGARDGVVAVALDNGMHVSAAAEHGETFAAGERVEVIENVHVFSGPSYEIAGTASAR